VGLGTSIVGHATGVGTGGGEATSRDGHGHPDGTARGYDGDDASGWRSDRGVWQLDAGAALPGATGSAIGQPAGTASEAIAPTARSISSTVL
jgi:hypothetical protein